MFLFVFCFIFKEWSDTGFWIPDDLLIVRETDFGFLLDVVVITSASNRIFNYSGNSLSSEQVQ